MRRPEARRDLLLSVVPLQPFESCMMAAVLLRRKRWPGILRHVVAIRNDTLYEVWVDCPLHDLHSTHRPSITAYSPLISRLSSRIFCERTISRMVTNGKVKL